MVDLVALVVVVGGRVKGNSERDTGREKEKENERRIGLNWTVSGSFNFNAREIDAMMWGMWIIMEDHHRQLEGIILVLLRIIIILITLILIHSGTLNLNLMHIHTDTDPKWYL